MCVRDKEKNKQFVVEEGMIPVGVVDESQHFSSLSLRSVINPHGGTACLTYVL